MNDISIGEVIGLFISQHNKAKRIEKNMIDLDTNGIIEDKFYAKKLERSVLLTSIESYLLASKNSIEMDYGFLGENILIDYNPYHLTIGTQLKISEVILEVTQPCTICKGLSSIDKALPRLLKDDRGIFVKVVKAGSIEKGDKLYCFKV